MVKKGVGGEETKNEVNIVHDYMREIILIEQADEIMHDRNA